MTLQTPVQPDPLAHLDPQAGIPGIPTERQSTLAGMRTLLLGETGCGKTYSLGKLIEMGFEVRILFTEPGMETIGQYFSDRKKPIPDNVQWHYIPPAAPSWDAMLDSATKINTLSFKMLSEMSDINKKDYHEFRDIISACANFVSDRNGKAYGPIDSWNTNTVFVVDSLSGLSVAAMNLVTGSKPVKSLADWGVAISNLEFLITKLTTALRCHFIMTAHLERETDETTGGTTLMASTIGKKLAPKIPRFFSDVIQAKREGAKFSWSTDTTGVALKARNLPIAGNLPADFATLIKSWESNGGVREA